MWSSFRLGTKWEQHQLKSIAHHLVNGLTKQASQDIVFRCWFWARRGCVAVAEFSEVGFEVVAVFRCSVLGSSAHFCPPSAREQSKPNQLTKTIASDPVTDGTPIYPGLFIYCGYPSTKFILNRQQRPRSSPSSSTFAAPSPASIPLALALLVLSWCGWLAVSHLPWATLS